MNDWSIIPNTHKKRKQNIIENMVLWYLLTTLPEAMECKLDNALDDCQKIIGLAHHL